MTCLRTSLVLLPQRGWKANSMLPWHLEVNIPMTHNEEGLRVARSRDTSLC